MRRNLRPRVQNRYDPSGDGGGDTENVVRRGRGTLTFEGPRRHCRYVETPWTRQGIAKTVRDGPSEEEVVKGQKECIRDSHRSNKSLVLCIKPPLKQYGLTRCIYGSPKKLLLTHTLRSTFITVPLLKLLLGHRDCDEGGNYSGELFFLSPFRRSRLNHCRVRNPSLADVDNGFNRRGGTLVLNRRDRSHVGPLSPRPEECDPADCTRPVVLSSTSGGRRQ